MDDCLTYLLDFVQANARAYRFGLRRVLDGLATLIERTGY
jgi:hypothetical protein